MTRDLPDRRVRVFGQLLLGVVGCVLLALIGRLVHIQRSLHSSMGSAAEKQQTSYRPLAGRRGLILDRKGRVLAASREKPSVYVDPELIEDLHTTAGALGRVLELDPGWVHHQIFARRHRRFAWIKRGVEPIEADAVRQLRLCGVSVTTEPRREYPLGASLAHVLGFVGLDDSGLEGVERAADIRLSGKPGRARAVVDARRRAIFPIGEGTRAPRDGGHVVLTIDAAIQEAVESVLEERVLEFEAESGVGIVTAPRTGEVLALACYPGFDPDQPTEFPVECRRNRAITDPVEPGSVFKPIIAAAVINEGLTSPDEIIDCENGEAWFGSRRLRDSHPMGRITMSRVVSHSSNIGMAKLGLRLGPARMYDYLRQYGFGEPTGVGLGGESGGVLYPVRRWSAYSPTSITMGQELAVTPLQLIAAFNAIANEGVLVRPRLISRVLDADGTVLEEHTAPVVVGQVLHPAVAQVMLRQILVETVTEGSGQAADLDRWQVAGKTGTAQVPCTDRRGYEPDAYLSSFIAAAPASDPQVSVLVMVRKPNPRIGYYGRKVAVPAVGRILEYALSYLQVPPDKPGFVETRVARH